MNALATLPQPSQPDFNHESDFRSQPVLDWIDREIITTHFKKRLYAQDALLDLRFVFSKNDFNEVISLFHHMLPRLEQKHYLLSYRIRHWLSLNFKIRVFDSLHRGPDHVFSLQPSTHSLKFMRNEYFQNVTPLIPWNEIQIEVIPSQQLGSHRKRKNLLI